MFLLVGTTCVLLVEMEGSLLEPYDYETNHWPPMDHRYEYVAWQVCKI